MTNVTEDTTRSVWAWTPYLLVREFIMSSSKNKSESRRQEKIVKARAHKSNEVKPIHFLVVAGLWVCELCDKDFNTPKKRGGAKTPRRSAKK